MGENTTYKHFYKPTLGASGGAEKTLFDTKLDRVDVLLQVDCNNYDHPDDAITAIGASNKTLVVTEAETCDVNFTVPANVTVRFERGGKWTIDNGVTVTFNGQIDAGLWQIFAYTGTGTLAGMSIIDKIYPQWWGALGDNSNDDTSAIQSAIDMGGNIIFFSAGTYLITSTLTIPYTQRNTTLEGVGGISSKISWGGGAAGIMLTIGETGQVSAPNYTQIRNLYFSGGYVAATCIKSWAGIAIFEKLRLGEVNNGIVLIIEDNSYYVKVNNVEFRNDGAHNSSAIQTNAAANAIDFNNLKIGIFQNYGVIISDTFNRMSFNGGSIEACDNGAIYISSTGTILSVTDMYIENCGGVGEGSIETTAAVAMLSLTNLYMNPGVATEYAVKVVGTYVEVEGIHIVPGFQTSIFNVDATSRLYQKSQIKSTDTVYSGAGIYNMDELNLNDWGIVSPGFTVLKNSGTKYVDLDLSYTVCNIELTIIGRFAAGKGITKKWIISAYPQSNDTVLNIESVEMYSLGDALKSNLTMAVSDPGVSYKVRFTFTNTDTTYDFVVYQIFWNVKWGKDNVLMKAPIPE